MIRIIGLHGAGSGKKGIDGVNLPDEPFFAAMMAIGGGFIRDSGPVDAAKAAGGSPKFTVHETGEHKMQSQKNLTPEVLDWLFSQSR